MALAPDTISSAGWAMNIRVPLPLVLQAEQCLRRSDPARHVDVMAAAMGHKRLPAVPAGLVAAGIGKAGFLFHRQRVEFGAHHDGGAIAIFIDGDQPGLAYLLGDIEAERAHFGGELGCGFYFLKGKFRMGVDVLVERVELWIVAFDRRLDRGLETGNIELCVRRQQAGREPVRLDTARDLTNRLMAWSP